MSRYHLGAIISVIGLAFGTAAVAQGISPEEYRASRKTISAEDRRASAQCGPLGGNAADVCRAEVSGRKGIARAELEARRHPSENSRREIGMAKANADYAVAKVQCAAKSRNDREDCLKAAKAALLRGKPAVGAQHGISQVEEISADESTSAMIRMYYGK